MQSSVCPFFAGIRRRHDTRREINGSPKSMPPNAPHEDRDGCRGLCEKQMLTTCSGRQDGSRQPTDNS